MDTSNVHHVLCAQSLHIEQVFAKERPYYQLTTADGPHPHCDAVLAVVSRYHLYYIDAFAH